MRSRDSPGEPSSYSGSSFFSALRLGAVAAEAASPPDPDVLPRRRLPPLFAALPPFEDVSSYPTGLACGAHRVREAIYYFP